jgi:hypothetical protein
MDNPHRLSLNLDLSNPTPRRLPDHRFLFLSFFPARHLIASASD